MPELVIAGWYMRLARVHRSQARANVFAMTRPQRDPNERAFSICDRAAGTVRGDSVAPVTKLVVAVDQPEERHRLT